MLIKHLWHFLSLVFRIFSCNGEEVKRLQFRDGGNYTAALREGSFDLFGDRVIKLGTNMWVLLHLSTLKGIVWWLGVSPSKCSLMFKVFYKNLISLKYDWACCYRKRQGLCVAALLCSCYHPDYFLIAICLVLFFYSSIFTFISKKICNDCKLSLCSDQQHFVYFYLFFYLLMFNVSKTFSLTVGLLEKGLTLEKFPKK